MCTWKRISKLQSTIDMLANQTYKDFEFIVWNNNNAIEEEVNELLSQAPFKATAKHWKANIGGIGRFYAAREAQTDYVVFIDDDQIFDSTLLQIFADEASPNTISGWWAWNMFGDYHKRAATPIGSTADYVGTGGMVVPQKTFLDDKLFTDLPEEFLFVEDLWLSRFFVAKHSGTLKKSSVYIQFMENEDHNNQHHYLRNQKSELYNWLQLNGYNNSVS